MAEFLTKLCGGYKRKGVGTARHESGWQACKKRSSFAITSNM